MGQRRVLIRNLAKAAPKPELVRNVNRLLGWILACEHTFTVEINAGEGGFVTSAGLWCQTCGAWQWRGEAWQTSDFARELRVLVTTPP